jgi:hypothetical protein
MPALTKTDTDPGTAGLLLRLKPCRLDAVAIRALVGDLVARTHAEVGREFGLAANTIKQSWAPQGMPGEQGAYPIAEILLWRLEYEAKIDRGRSQFADLEDRELDRKQKEAEARKLELQADRLEREEAQAMGNLWSRQDVVTAWSAIFAVTAERLMVIPDDFAPELPTEMVSQIVDRCRTKIDHVLVGLSEAGEEVIRRLTEGGSE